MFKCFTVVKMLQGMCFNELILQKILYSEVHAFWYEIYVDLIRLK